jgi:hypothetical protein
MNVLSALGATAGGFFLVLARASLFTIVFSGGGRLAAYIAKSQLA